MRYSIIQPDGAEVSFTPAAKRISLAEMQQAVGGDVEHVPMLHGGSLWVNENGRLVGLPVNEKASRLAHPDWLWAGPLVGPVLVHRPRRSK